MKYSEVEANAVGCPQCSAQVPQTLLVCPACGALMRAAELKQIAAEAAAARNAGNASAEAEAWRSALELLPVGCQQHVQLLERIRELTREGAGAKPPRTVAQPTAGDTVAYTTASGPVYSSQVGSMKNAAGRGHGKGAKKTGQWALVALVIGLLLKFKWLVVALLTKGKLLLFGLTKASTFFSMLLSFSLYWTLWGWKFAAGLVVGIYIHEMGHVAALRKLGIKATAPMFIPGFGALVRLKQYPADAREDARIGLAGPIWGLGASVAAALVYFATGSPVWAAIARVNSWINLFNLIPISPLDGGRGFRVLKTWQRATIAVAFGAAYLVTQDGLLALLAIVAVVMVFAKKQEVGNGDQRAFAEYLILIAALSALVLIKVPGQR